MLMLGKNIQSPADQLQKVQEDYLYHRLVNPKPEVISVMEQLRIVYTIDTTRYSQLKRQLAYIVCGIFNPPFRRKENFAYTESFILDFDHLSIKNIECESLKKKICKDNRVVMCFTSPSQDGLKVMFKLKERCYDSGLYTLFYKAFAASLAKQFNLEQVLDSRTSDVTRACFISVDPNTYYNPFAESIDLTTFVDINNPLATFNLKEEQAKEENEQKKNAQHTPQPKDPTKDIIAQIRSTLHPNASIIKREAYVPTQLNNIIEPLCNKIKETGIEVTEVINIQYAKKIRCCLGLKQGELNIFYGKKGYSVVISPRRGTDEELNHLLADITQAFLADQSQLPY